MFVSSRKFKPQRLPLNSIITIFFSTSSSSSSQIPLSITNLFTKCKSLLDAKRLHQQITVTGLTHTNPNILHGIIDIYLEFHAPSLAISALERLSPCKFTTYLWNSIIRSTVKLHSPLDAFELYLRMRKLGWRPDDFTFPLVLKACGEIPSYRRGASVHAVVCIDGYECNVFVCNAVVVMYSRCGGLDDARQVFDEMSQRGVGDVISWNSIVAAYVKSSDPKTALKMFVEMTRRSEFGFRPDAFSLVNILPACASIKAPLRGKQIHCFATRTGLFEDVFVGNAIVDMYAKCGLMDEANKVFLRMKEKDVVSWNSMVTGYSQIGRFEDALNLFEKMRREKIELDVVTWSAAIAGYAQRGLGYEALNVFREMQLCGSVPNAVTLVSLLSGCASDGALLQGKETHCYAIKHILNLSKYNDGDDLMVINGLVDMYAKCKSANIAHKLFDSINPKDKNVVTWTVMIGGYAQHGESNEALKLFSEMLNQGNSIKPNAYTISCGLMACARLAALRFGREIHAYIIRNRYESDMLFVSNCLIDMYAKSGDVDAAQQVFDEMNVTNTVSWTSLMTGYGMHGRGEEALRVFNDMKKVGLPIDGVTFLVVFYACSHSGLVDQGTEFFNTMSRDFNIEPGIEHFVCMVDLLGRAGRLDEAMKLIKNMPMEPTPVLWMALLSACRTHKNVELGEYAASRLSELDLGNDGSYTLLSNIYANDKRWEDVARIRCLMKCSGIKKKPGCSWVQGKKGTVTFFVGDKSHQMSKQIYDLLADLIRRIKAMGYVPETSYDLHDVDDEEKSDLLFEHSEKLALAYGILNTAPGLPIRITKNLRVCGDCHTAITYISMIVDHVIILRDSSRFHHFKNGSCSCRGFW